jgi:hypothetical protein
MCPKIFRIEYPCSAQSADSNRLSDFDIAGFKSELATRWIQSMISAFMGFSGLYWINAPFFDCMLG